MQTNPEILSQLNTLFDQAYVLTLPHAKNRQQDIARSLEGLNWQFFYGVDKNNLSDEQLLQGEIYDDAGHRRMQRTSRSMNKGEVACALSHRNIYQDAIDKGHKHILIFEDDVLPCYQALSRLPAQMSQLPADWNLLMLGYYNEKRPTLRSSLEVQLYQLYRKLHIANWQNVSKRFIDQLVMKDYSEDFYAIGKVVGAHAYALNLETAKKFVDFQTPVRVQADRIFNYCHAAMELKAFAPKRQVFTLSELSQESYIQSHQFKLWEQQKALGQES